MIGFLSNLSRIGVTEELPERESRRIVFLNILVIALQPLHILLALLCVAYLPATRPLLIVAIVHFVCCNLTPFLTHLHKYLAARIWFCVVTTFFAVVATAMVGTEPRLHLFLIVCIFLMFFKFPTAQRPWMYLFIGLYSVCLITLEILFRNGGLIAGLPREFMTLLYYFSTIGLVFCAISVGGLGYLTLSNAEERLARDNGVIQDKTPAAGDRQQLTSRTFLPRRATTCASRYTR